MALPVFSVETPEEAETLKVFLCSLVGRGSHPAMIGRYVFPPLCLAGDDEAFRMVDSGEVTAVFRAAYDHMLSRRAGRVGAPSGSGGK